MSEIIEPNMERERRKSRELVAFIFYCITFMGIGAIITGLGPLIPYFAERENREATQYSFLFFARAAGYCLGSLLCKIWEKYFKFHNICFVASVSIAFCLIGFSWTPNMTFKALFMFLASISNATLEIFINMSIIEAKKDDHLDKWLQVVHGAFGVGGLIGPLLVYFLEQWSYGAMCIIFVVSAPAYILMPSPEAASELEAQGQEALLEKQQKQPKKIISFGMSMLICGLFMLLVGEETAFGGWVSSYAVINHIQNKEDATFYGSLFWVTVTLFRFIFLVLPGKPSKKSLVMYIISVFVAGSSLLFLHVFPQQASAWVIYSSVGFGIAFSILFPLLLSTPKEFGIDLKPSDNSNFVIAASLGEGIVAVLTGYLMDWFGSDMLFYSILGVNVVVLIGHWIMVRELNKEAEEYGIVVSGDERESKKKESGGFEIFEGKFNSDAPRTTGTDAPRTTGTDAPRTTGTDAPRTTGADEEESKNIMNVDVDMGKQEEVEEESSNKERSNTIQSLL